MPRLTRFDRAAPLPPHENLTVQEVANFLRVSQSAVYSAVNAGELQHIRLGCLIRIPRSQFLAWYQSFFSRKVSG